MRIFVLSKMNVLGYKEVIGLFSELQWAKEYAERQVKSFSWIKRSDDTDMYVSDFVGPRPAYTIESHEVDPE